MTVFEQICEEYYPRIYRYLLGISSSHELAEELTQETFLIAYQKGKEFIHHEKPLAFLYKTACNLAKEQYRRQRREQASELSDEQFPSCEDVFTELAVEHENSVNVEPYIKVILDSLSDQQRTLYRKYYEEHKSMREIAREIGLSEPAVRMKYVRLRREIRRRVSNLRLGDF